MWQSLSHWFEQSWLYLLALLVLIGLALVVLGWTSLPMGLEFQVVQSAREAYTHNGWFAPSLNGTVTPVPMPLYTVILSVLLLISHHTLLVTKSVALVCAVLMLLAVIGITSRMFHVTAGLIAGGLLIGTWCFFSNSITSHGVFFYGMWCLLALLLFFNWFDHAFRSRTLARSLYFESAIQGVALGLCGLSAGIPGLLFPLGVMTVSIVLTERLELLEDLNYQWIGLPMVVILVLGWGFYALSWGVWPTLLSVFPFQFQLSSLLQGPLSLLPVGLLFIPSFWDKDLWSRALLSHQRPLAFSLAWLITATVLSLFFGQLAPLWSVLLALPALFWAGFAWYEVFRNPVLPTRLSLAIDSVILLMLLLGVCSMFWLVQMASPSLQPAFLLLSVGMVLMAIFLIIIREVATSRVFMAVMISFSLVSCVLFQISVLGLLQFQPENELASQIPRAPFQQPDTCLIAWRLTEAPVSPIRLRIPLQNPIVMVETPQQLVQAVTHRKGQAFVMLPEPFFFPLQDWFLSQHAANIGRSWQWHPAMSFWQLLRGLGNETLDFKGSAETIHLLWLPAPLKGPLQAEKTSPRLPRIDVHPRSATRTQAQPAEPSTPAPARPSLPDAATPEPVPVTTTPPMAG